MTAFLFFLAALLPVFPVLDGPFHQNLSGLLALGLVLAAQLVPVIVDRPEQTGQRQIQGRGQRDQKQQDRDGPADGPIARQAENHGKQAAKHAAGLVFNALPVQHAEHIQAPDGLGFPDGKMGQGGNQQRKADRAEHPHGHGFSAVEEQGDGAEDQADGQHDQADPPDHAHKEVRQRAGFVQAA